jgi:hypothetical protein
MAVSWETLMAAEMAEKLVPRRAETTAKLKAVVMVETKEGTLGSSSVQLKAGLMADRTDCYSVAL